MNALVFLKGKQPTTTSLIVAERTKTQHESIIRLINKHKARFERWGAIRFSDLKSGNPHGGRPIQFAYLNEQQATFLTTLLRNNDDVLDFKEELVKQFYEMREVLLNRQNEEWQQLRRDSKEGNKRMCDVVHDYIIPLARANGSTTPDKMFYMNYQKAVNRAACVQPNSRDNLPLTQLYAIEVMQEIVEASIKGRAASGETNHKQIFRDTNQMLENYSRISLIPQRFLPA